MQRSTPNRRAWMYAAALSMIMAAMIAASARAHADCCDVFIDVTRVINCPMTIDIIDNLTNNVVFGKSYLPGAQDLAYLPCPFNYTARIWGPNGPVLIPFGTNLPIWLNPECCVYVRTAQDNPNAPCWVIHVEPC